MSTEGDHLAPVTPLFGGGRKPAADGWAESADAGPDEPEVAREPAADRESTGARESVADRRAEAARESDAVGEPAADTAAAPPPTFATFWGGKAAVEPVLDATGDDEGADEPEETLEAAQHRAENISMHALARRGVSSREMERTLRSRDLPDDVVAAEVERLERVGLLNDSELAETLVRSKQERKGLGKSAISAELKQRGLAAEAIEQAIAEIDDDDEQARADEWARKRAGQLRGLDHETAERRLSGFLMRRGYRSEVVRRAIAQALPRGGSSRGGVRFE